MRVVCWESLLLAQQDLFDTPGDAVLHTLPVIVVALQSDTRKPAPRPRRQSVVGDLMEQITNTLLLGGAQVVADNPTPTIVETGAIAGLTIEAINHRAKCFSCLHPGRNLVSWAFQLRENLPGDTRCNLLHTDLR